MDCSLGRQPQLHSFGPHRVVLQNYLRTERCSYKSSYAATAKKSDPWIQWTLDISLFRLLHPVQKRILMLITSNPLNVRNEPYWTSETHSLWLGEPLTCMVLLNRLLIFVSVVIPHFSIVSASISSIALFGIMGILSTPMTRVPGARSL